MHARKKKKEDVNMNVTKTEKVYDVLANLVIDSKKTIKVVKKVRYSLVEILGGTFIERDFSKWSFVLRSLNCLQKIEKFYATFHFHVNMLFLLFD